MLLIGQHPLPFGDPAQLGVTLETLLVKQNSNVLY